uniref:Uncharacterized protein n=1 Tax=Rhizophora mucronata TaxID=61149 RepID=A0A2P2QYN5_RHIMU
MYDTIFENMFCEVLSGYICRISCKFPLIFCWRRKNS